MSRLLLILSVSLLGLSLAGCGQSQSGVMLSTYKKADQPPYVMADNKFVAAKWQSGDRQSWEAVMRSRVSKQDEYVRGE